MEARGRSTGECDAETSPHSSWQVELPHLDGAAGSVVRQHAGSSQRAGKMPNQPNVKMSLPCSHLRLPNRVCRRDGHADCETPIAGAIPYCAALAAGPACSRQSAASTGCPLRLVRLQLRRILARMSSCCHRPRCGQREQLRTEIATGQSRSRLGHR